MVTIFSGYGTATLIILAMMVPLWLLSLWQKDASIVDIFWGIGFVFTAWVYFFLTPDGFMTKKKLITIITTILGLSLSIHISLSNVLGVSLLKKTTKDAKPGYKEYAENTNAFFPWFP